MNDPVRTNGLAQVVELTYGEGALDLEAIARDVAERFRT